MEAPLEVNAWLSRDMLKIIIVAIVIIIAIIIIIIRITCCCVSINGFWISTVKLFSEVVIFFKVVPTFIRVLTQRLGSYKIDEQRYFFTQKKAAQGAKKKKGY